MWRTLYVLSIGGIVAVQSAVLISWAICNQSAAPGCSDVVLRFAWCLLLFIVGGAAWIADPRLPDNGDGCDVSLHALFHVCAAWALYLTMTLSLHFRVPGSVCVPAHSWTRLTLYTVAIPSAPMLARLPPT